MVSFCVNQIWCYSRIWVMSPFRACGGMVHHNLEAGTRVSFSIHAHISINNKRAIFQVQFPTKALASSLVAKRAVATLELFLGPKITIMLKNGDPQKCHIPGSCNLFQRNFGHHLKILYRFLQCYNLKSLKESSSAISHVRHSRSISSC